MNTPVILITGVDPAAMATTMVGLQWDLPHAVAVRHHIDAERQVLVRVVSDATGLVDRAEIPLDHACVSCALREDVIPTLERVARDGRWSTVIAHLPVGAEASQVCGVIAWDPRLARHLRITSVVASLTGASVVDDLLGDDLLRERDLQSSPDDARGIGEVAASMVEYADVVVVAGPADATALELLRTLARPDAALVVGTEQLDAPLVAGQLHDHARTCAWTDPLRAGVVATALPGGDPTRVWSLDLRSRLPFHPGRLLTGLATLGGGRHRSRGCFWLPTRPGQALAWAGAGGQLSVGTSQPWGRRAPMTRIVLTGVGTAPAHLRPAFDALLVTAAEQSAGVGRGPLGEDGFEPWLGPIRDVA